MRSFDYTHIPSSLLTLETMNLISAIHEYKGKQELFLAARADVLDALADVAKVQSTDASNSIEGISTTNKRLKEIMADKTTVKSRAEEEIIGYRDVLNTIHENFEYIPLSSNVIQQFHRDLYRYTPSSTGGIFKAVDNKIQGTTPEGVEYIRFSPVPAITTPTALENICQAYKQGILEESVDPLIVMLQFVFDFTCIHPFRDGNGRMSRLLNLLLLYKSGYLVGKYVSLEKEIERTKDTYYATLEESSEGWHENDNDPAPFINYMLKVILACYKDFESRVSLVSIEKTRKKASKPERVEAVLSNSLGKVTKTQILDACPDISKVTVERTLYALVVDEKVEKVGAGRNTGYVWKG